ncbi:hypothetical protein CSUB01_09630 [Colletotrichum sublineola]|uniref:F-box domain-containing protein n=1 Tax=Colletotrichum sublineola TaxID=1173701 RepID=A0A066XLG4_COLSU|nr:hypothetical protein CSUB01_09630 [Colletotrichum sublineola]
MLLVIGYLSPEAVLSLALTCRLFYVSYFPESPIIDARSEDSLLALLERDVPCLVYCPECAILHPWRRPGDAMLWAVRSGLRCKPRALNPPSFRGWMPYHHARLVMNRHLYGKAHGFSVELLNTDINPWLGGRVACRSTWRVRIVDDELFLFIYETVNHPEGDMGKLEKWLEDGGGRICKHRFAWDLPRRTSQSNMALNAGPELQERMAHFYPAARIPCRYAAQCDLVLPAMPDGRRNQDQVAWRAQTMGRRDEDLEAIWKMPLPLRSNMGKPDYDTKRFIGASMESSGGGVSTGGNQVQMGQSRQEAGCCHGCWMLS